MRKTITKTMTGGAAAMLAATLAMTASTPASAGVTGCSAPGGKQTAGAVIGAVVGGLIGNKVGGRQPALETVGGAAVGAAAGSAIGCEMQKGRTDSYAAQPSTYNRNGYRLSADVAPASYSRIGQPFVATSGVNLRSAPTTDSARVGRLRAGERFQALAQVRGTDWILVGQGGVGVGYVRGDFVQPDGYRYASY